MSDRARAFLCHASEDKELAERIATDLQQAGIETFFDKWSIGIGDSLRQRIDTGIEDCTHFITLLTPTSIEKPWVKAEIDGGFIKKIQGQARFLPLRYSLPVECLPPLLRALYAPEITEATYEQDIRRLIDDIYNRSQRPPLGPAPDFVRRFTEENTGLSSAASQIAKLFCERSSLGRGGDPTVPIEELCSALRLEPSELEIAVAELEEHSYAEPVRAIFARPLGYHSVRATRHLFVELDRAFMGWDPRSDAVQLAAYLVNGQHRWLSAQEACDRLGWSPRRMNPALTYLIDHDAVLPSKSIDATFEASQVAKNDRTARFLRDRE